MAAFEFNQEKKHEENAEDVAAQHIDSKKVKEECIIALKVYDSCRSQDCLTFDQLGPARAAECACFGTEQINEGDIIIPPRKAASVTIDKLRVKKIFVVNKEPNHFKNGFWDVDVKYVFVYRLTFKEADGCPIASVKANSVFNRKVALFGSIDSDLVIATDLFSDGCDSTMLDSDPFILVEAKGVALAAEIYHPRHICEDEASEVRVTIGLFSIIKLFRIVNLTVESRGFCIPEECSEISPMNPCDFFNSLEFPMNIFAPLQKEEFLAKEAVSPCGCE